MSQERAVVAGTRITELAAQWRQLRRMHSFYVRVARHGGVAAIPSAELDSPIDRNDAEAIRRASHWFDEMDDVLGVQHLRAYLQTAADTDEELFRALLQHHLGKEQKKDSDRDKVDYLLVQYFAHCAPPGMRDENLELDYVAQVLERVVGPVFAKTPEWLSALDQLFADVESCRSLTELLKKKVLEVGRALKTSAGEMFYEPAAMVAFTRFNYLLRRSFFRLMHADVDAVFECLRRLEILKVNVVDARAAGLSEQQSLGSLRDMCLDWKTPFRAEYSAGQPLQRLAQIRLCLETEVEKATAAAGATVKAQAATAGVGSFPTNPGPTQTQGSEPAGEGCDGSETAGRASDPAGGTDDVCM